MHKIQKLAWLKREKMAIAYYNEVIPEVYLKSIANYNLLAEVHDIWKNISTKGFNKTYIYYMIFLI